MVSKKDAPRFIFLAAIGIIHFATSWLWEFLQNSACKEPSHSLADSHFLMLFSHCVLCSSNSCFIKVSQVYHWFLLQWKGIIWPAQFLLLLLDVFSLLLMAFHPGWILCGSLDFKEDIGTFPLTMTTVPFLRTVEPFMEVSVDYALTPPRPGLLSASGLLHLLGSSAWGILFYLLHLGTR